MGNIIPDPGTDDARSEDGPQSDAGREEAVQAATEALKDNGSDPRSSLDLAIQKRAYSLWEAEGRPDGLHEDHWRRATRELTENQLSAGDPSPPGP